MLTTKTRAAALVAHLDHLIAKYEHTHPEIAFDLRSHRDALLDYTKRHNKIDAAKAALRVAVLVKFIMDRWPDG